MGCMDYRPIDLSRLAWCGLKVSYGGAGSLGVQTPPARYRAVASHKFGLGCRDLHLTGLPAAFLDFLREIEASARMGVDLKGLTPIDTVAWGGTVRLSAFDGETLWFDRDGALVEHTPLEPHTGVCALLVQVVGIWKSPRSWGLKLKVKEVKELDPAKAPPDTSWAFA
jgi:hypothetical protein